VKSIFSLLLAVCLLASCSFSSALATESVLPLDDSPGLTPQPDGYLSDLSYKDPSIEVVIEPGRAYETDYWVARIKIASPSQLRTAAASTFDSNRTTSGKAMAKRMQAVLETISPISTMATLSARASCTVNCPAVCGMCC
jgi:hypothetical protein